MYLQNPQSYGMVSPSRPVKNTILYSSYTEPLGKEVDRDERRGHQEVQDDRLERPHGRLRDGGRSSNVVSIDRGPFLGSISWVSS